jgi:signal peptidase
MIVRWRGWQTAALAAVLATLVPLTMFLVSAWLLGWQLMSVQTGSMSPTLAVGSLVVVAPVDPADVEVGMAIAFQDPADPARLITHRVVGLAPGPDLAFITKGDANATGDAMPVPARLVRGRALWHVTYLGTVMDWLQWPRSFVVLVLLPGLLLAAAEIRGRRRGPPGQSVGGAGEGLPIATAERDGAA